MKSWFALVDMIGLFVLMIIMVTTFNRMNIYEQEYNAQRLQKATEYSTEAAFSETLAQNNADTDYEKLVSITVDNRKTLGTFDDLMCFNYGLTRTDRSRSAIEDSIRTGVLATDDGFYVLTLQKDSPDSKKLMWTPKLPYTNYDSTNNQTVAFNLQNNEYKAISYNASSGNLKYSFGRDGTKATGGSSDLKIDASKFNRMRRQAISSSITDAITWSADNNDEIRGEADFGSYIPSKQTTSGINAITAPTLMFIMQGGGYTGEVAYENVSVAGYRAIHQVRTLIYERNGQKKYAYEWQIPTEEMPEQFDWVDSPEKAAAEGYTPDYDYIFRPINYISQETPNIKTTE